MWPGYVCHAGCLKVYAEREHCEWSIPDLLIFRWITQMEARLLHTPYLIFRAIHFVQWHSDTNVKIFRFTDCIRSFKNVKALSILKYISRVNFSRFKFKGKATVDASLMEPPETGNFPCLQEPRQSHFPTWDWHTWSWCCLSLWINLKRWKATIPFLFFPPSVYNSFGILRWTNCYRPSWHPVILRIFLENNPCFIPGLFTFLYAPK